MRIIYYSPHPTHDIVSEVGYATHQREVIQALMALGHEVIPVILGGTEVSNLNQVSSNNYQVPVYKKFLKLLVPRFIWTTLNNYQLRIHDRKASVILEQKINEAFPDLIYERSEYLQDSGAKLALKYKIKYFLEVNAPFVEEMNEFEGYSLYHSLAHKIEAYKLNAATQVFTVSSSLKGFLHSRYHCDVNKIFVQANCINPEKIKIDAASVQAIRMELNIKDEKIIGFVGSMFPYHGVDILIQAFSIVLDEYPNSKLLIVGDGIVLNDLKKLTRDLSIQNSVIFTGKIAHKEVFNYIQTMDICIMAKSNWYGSPVKIFEYGLLKKPIIAPDNGPIRDVMVHLEDAFLVQENSTDLKNAILQLLNDEKLANKLALQFYSKILSHYKWSNAADTIIKICG